MIKCAICGRELKQPCHSKGPFEDVCPKCFSQRFWDLAEEENLKGTKFIIDGTCYAHDSNDPHGFGGRIFLVQLLPNHPLYLSNSKHPNTPEEGRTLNTWEFKGTLWSNGPIPENQRNKETGRLMDNAIWFNSNKDKDRDKEQVTK